MECMYRCHTSLQVMRKFSLTAGMVYVQHANSCARRAILKEKELETRQAIASEIASPPELHPKVILEQAAMTNDDAIMINGDTSIANDNGAAQVLVLGSRGSTAEGWLTTPESASSPDRSTKTAGSAQTEAAEEVQLPLFQESRDLPTAGSGPTEAIEVAQVPILQESLGAGWLDKGVIPSDISNDEAANTAAAAEEEALPEVETDAENTIQQESTWDNPRQVDSSAEDTAVWEDSQGIAAAAPDHSWTQNDITDAITKEAALNSPENDGQLDEPLPAKEVVATVAEEYADEPLAEPAVEEIEADEDVADKLVRDDELMKLAPVEEKTLIPEEEEVLRPDTEIYAMVESLTEAAAAEDVPTLQEGQIENSDSESPMTNTILAGTDFRAITLDHLISQHHRQSSLLASAGVDTQLLLEQDAIAADSTESRPATAVSQTVYELVAAAEAQLTPLLALPATEVQDAEEQISPANPTHDGYLAHAPDDPLMPPLLALPAAELQDTEEQISPAGPVQDEQAPDDALVPPLLAAPAAEVQDAEEQVTPARPVQDVYLAHAPDDALVPPLLAAPAAEVQGAEVQGAEEQVIPAGPKHDGYFAHAPDTALEMAEVYAESLLFRVASPTTEKPLDTAGLTTDNYAVIAQPDLAEAELIGAPEDSAELIIKAFGESDTTTSTLEDVVEEGTETPKTTALMIQGEFEPAADLQGQSDETIGTAALGPTVDAEAKLQEATAQYENDVYNYNDGIYADEDSERKAELLQPIGEVVEESIGGLVEDTVANL